MRLNKQTASTITCSLLAMFPCLAVMAQDAATPAVTNTSSYNNVMILMVTITLVLAFVIWGLGQVLVALGRQAMDKERKSKALPVTLLVILMGLSAVANAKDADLPPTATAVLNYGGMSSTAFWLLAAVILIEIIAIAYIMFFIRRIQAELMPPKEKSQVLLLKQLWQRLDKKLFTKAVAVEQEADILLDHDYDGIKELDNALPPWWKYGFYITIAVAFIYMINFHVLGYGKNPTEEYQEELAKAQVEMELYEAKNADKIDESNLQMPLAAGINSGKDIFTAACWACHGKLGEGGAGPNLTDDYWIHKGSLKDVYLSIKHGYPDKGMQAWEKSYSPKEINNLAGFIKSLRGTNPAGAKAPQGDLYTETAPVDSTSLVKNSIDSSSVKK